MGRDAPLSAAHGLAGGPTRPLGRLHASAAMVCDVRADTGLVSLAWFGGLRNARQALAVRHWRGSQRAQEVVVDLARGPDHGGAAGDRDLDGRGSHAPAAPSMRTVFA